MCSSDLPAADVGGFHGVTDYGLRVAKAVDAVLQSLAGDGARQEQSVDWYLLPPQLVVSVDQVTMPVHNEQFLQAIQAGLPGYEVDQSGSVTTWVGRVVLGRGDARAEALTIPGEVVTRLGIQIRGLMQSPHAFVLALTHDTLGVFLPWDEWMTGRNGNAEEAQSLGVNGGVLLYQALSGLR